MEETPITPAEGTQTVATSESSPMPDLHGMSKEDLAGLLDKVNAGGQQQSVAPPQVQQGQVKPQGGQADPLANVLNKFGLTPEQIAQNPGLQKMAQSYSEAEKTLSRNFQEVSNAKKENEELRRIASDYDAQIQKLMSQPQSPQTPQPQEEDAYTPEQIEAFNKNPMGWMKNESKRMAEEIVEQKLKGVEEKSSQERLLDNQIFMATAQARQNLPGFQSLEPEIAKILDSQYIDRNPAAIEMAYQAALGKQFPQALAFAQNKAFSEGYEKAKSEMGKAVEVGRSSIPMGDGQLSLNGLKGMTKDQLAGMVQRVD